MSRQGTHICYCSSLLTRDRLCFFITSASAVRKILVRDARALWSDAMSFEQSGKLYRMALFLLFLSWIKSCFFAYLDFGLRMSGSGTMKEQDDAGSKEQRSHFLSGELKTLKTTVWGRPG